MSEDELRQQRLKKIYEKWTKNVEALLDKMEKSVKHALPDDETDSQIVLYNIYAQTVHRAFGQQPFILQNRQVKDQVYRAAETVERVVPSLPEGYNPAEIIVCTNETEAQAYQAKVAKQPDVYTYLIDAESKGDA